MIISRLTSMVKFSLLHCEVLLNMNVYIVDLNGTSGAGDLTSAELDTAASKIVNEIQLGNFSQIINVSQDTTYSIAEPPPSPSSSEWEEIKTDDNPYTSLYVVDAMVFKPALVPQHEGVPFATQPKVQIVDKNVRDMFVYILQTNKKCIIFLFEIF